ncbi:hypothetical protein B4U79_09101 [Dinothrombium tinctorium]|uniref:Inosine triphosphate pyrophosphatase n=1 Tax=Dinothrombium tinctorium TaxID=1965070 RepID=A0A3S3Q7E9_9ACAR|nr:hypothetical protein B4U79_09101 [Dinothrombium tinctorium]
MFKTITFVTGNKKKLEEVTAILGDSLPFRFEARALDLIETQGEADHVSEAKCKAAAEIVKGPVVVEDTCLCYNALKGLPGPYIKWFLDKLQPEGLYRLLEGWQDKRAQAVCTLAFSQGPNCEVKLFKGIVNGTIVPPRGPRDFGWDPCFQPEGYEQTYAELGPDVKHKISHRYLAVKAFRDYLKSLQ